MDKVDIVVRLMKAISLSYTMSTSAHKQADMLLALSNRLPDGMDRKALRDQAEKMRTIGNKFDAAADAEAALGYSVWKGMGEIDRKTVWPEYKFTGVKYNDCPPAFRNAAPLPDVVRVDCNSKQ